MNLAKYLHGRWANSAELNTVLSVSRVFTGRSPLPTRPYVLISKECQRPVSRQSDGSALDKILVRFRIFHDYYDVGNGILQKLKLAFEGIAFNMEGEDRVLKMYRVEDREHQHETGEWEFVVDFECLVYLRFGS